MSISQRIQIIAEKIQQLITMTETFVILKARFKAAIEAKGQSLTNKAFTEYPNEILKIQTSVGVTGLEYTLSNDENDETYYIASGLGDASELESIYVARSLNGIPVKEIAFNGSVTPASVKTLFIPSTVESIANNGLSDLTFLQEIHFETGCRLKYIGADAFSNCTALASIAIPISVISIGARAFSGCTHLSDVHISKSSLVSIDPQSPPFSSASPDLKIYVPDTLYFDYAGRSEDWGKFNARDFDADPYDLDFEKTLIRPESGEPQNWTTIFERATPIEVVDGDSIRLTEILKAEYVKNIYFKITAELRDKNYTTQVGNYFVFYAGYHGQSGSQWGVAAKRLQGTVQLNDVIGYMQFVIEANTIKFWGPLGAGSNYIRILEWDQLNGMYGSIPARAWITKIEALIDYSLTDMSSIVYEPSSDYVAVKGTANTYPGWPNAKTSLNLEYAIQGCGFIKLTYADFDFPEDPAFDSQCTFGLTGGSSFNFLDNVNAYKLRIVGHVTPTSISFDSIYSTHPLIQAEIVMLLRKIEVIGGTLAPKGSDPVYYERTADGNVGLIDASNFMGDVLPDTFMGLPVTSIDASVSTNALDLTFPGCYKDILRLEWLSANVLSKVIFLEGVERIGDNALNVIGSVHLPASVRRVGTNGITTNGDVYFYGIVPPVFGLNPLQLQAGCRIYVPTESIEIYKILLGYVDDQGTYADRIQVIPEE